MSRLSNLLVRMAEGWSRIRSNVGFPNEPNVVIGPHGPELRYEKPVTNEQRGWDSKHYERGNIHLQGFQNPLQIVPRESGKPYPRDSGESETGYVADGGQQMDVEVEQLNEVGILPSTNFKTALVSNDAIPKGMNPEPFADMLLYVKVTAVLAAVAALGAVVAASGAL